MNYKKLINKYIMFIDKNSAWRLHKVIKITGRTLTILNPYKEKHRIHPSSTKILGMLKNRRVTGKSYKEYLEEITWK